MNLRETANEYPEYAAPKEPVAGKKTRSGLTLAATAMAALAVLGLLTGPKEEPAAPPEQPPVIEVPATPKPSLPPGSACTVTFHYGSGDPLTLTKRPAADPSDTSDTYVLNTKVGETLREADWLLEAEDVVIFPTRNGATLPQRRCFPAGLARTEPGISRLP